MKTNKSELRKFNLMFNCRKLKQFAALLSLFAPWFLGQKGRDRVLASTLERRSIATRQVRVFPKGRVTPEGNRRFPFGLLLHSL